MGQVTYTKPPLVEVAISVQFGAIPTDEFSDAHLGAFWKELSTDFPIAKSTGLIPNSSEPFGENKLWTPTEFQLSLTHEPRIRLQMISNDKEWMCQLQHNRVVVNWRRKNDEYPRFAVAWDKFKKYYSRLVEYARLNGIDEINPHVWEVTYVNKIMKSVKWCEIGDLHKVFPGLITSPSVLNSGDSMCSVAGRWVVEQTSIPARLYIELKPPRESMGTADSLVFLNLTARGPVDFLGDECKNDSYGVIQGKVSSGHEWIVRAFDSILSPEAQEEWGRK